MPEAQSHSPFLGRCPRSALLLYGEEAARSRRAHRERPSLLGGRAEVRGTAGLQEGLPAGSGGKGGELRRGLGAGGRRGGSPDHGGAGRFNAGGREGAADGGGKRAPDVRARGGVGPVPGGRRGRAGTGGGARGRREGGGAGGRPGP